MTFPTPTTLGTVSRAVSGAAGGGGSKKVMITGVGKGLGRALALELDKRGHTVIGCARSQDTLDSLQSQFSSDNHLLLYADVKSNSSVEELALNNAGTINQNKKIWEVSEEEFDSVIDTNVKGVANMLRHFIPLMIPNKQGIVVNMSSGWGRSGAALVAPYCASKWAVEGLSRSVAKELPEGMAIVALNPGVIHTDMLTSCFGTSASLYQDPDTWALKAAMMILNLTAADNGASLTVPNQHPGHLFVTLEIPTGLSIKDFLPPLVLNWFVVMSSAYEYKLITDLQQLVTFMDGTGDKRERAKNFVAMATVVMSHYCKPSPFLGQFPSHFAKSSSRQVVETAVQESKISALFWGSKKSVEPKELNISLSIISSISEVSSNEWDACNLDATGPDKFNPFLTHAFLSSLEESRSAVKETGWMPSHIVAKDETDNVLGVVPLYLKSHSYGEFVFDHSWADAYYNFGSRYYPKFQCCVPFTPVTGPRILVRNTPFRDQLFDVLVSALKDLAAKVSSLHITFPTEKEWHSLKEKGFLQRIGMQYHWKNHNYKNFDEFLMDMKQSKRKNIRQERKKVITQNLNMKRLRGYEIKARHWDTFYSFYRNTTDNKWGTPYLTRDFFHNLGSKMGDQVLLVVAEEGDELVAGALNIIGGDTLFGRLWGCHQKAYYPSLHFEACYYQAIEAAIELNLNTVEAGAQGEHKIQRGYLPVTTYSCHYLIDEAFRKVIEEFLVRESNQVKLVMKLIRDSGPLKEGIQ
uniref:Uncharacterized protein n=1 Tax=Salix viminalis TaxID=40686 RepID=A0A6N2KEU7_SALVM